MTATEPTLTQAEFDRVYDRCILERHFVEDPAYYEAERRRFFATMRDIARLGLGPGTRTLDIGGGIMAVLLKELFGHDAHVGDVNERAAGDVEAAGLSFVHVDLFRDPPEVTERFDLVVLTEVIEHIPQPPYIVFGRIAAYLKPGGVLFLTTPNGHRLRNLVRMALGREILDIYRYPEPGEALGHQHEYRLRQMLWQVVRAGYSTVFAELSDNAGVGHSTGARIGRLLAGPVMRLVPHFRERLVLAARR